MYRNEERSGLVIKTDHLKNVEFMEFMKKNVINIMGVAILNTSQEKESLEQKSSEEYEEYLEDNYCYIYFSKSGELDLITNEQYEEGLPEFFGKDIYKKLKMALEEDKKEYNKTMVKSVFIPLPSYKIDFEKHPSAPSAVMFFKKEIIHTPSENPEVKATQDNKKEIPTGDIRKQRKKCIVM